MLSIYDNINILEKNIHMELMKNKGAIILDFNGVIYTKYKDNTKVVKCLINLLNLGFKVIINTNNRANEILDKEKSLLKYKNKFFLDYVKKSDASNFTVYADNRTGFYKYNCEKEIMEEDKSYKVGKDFYKETDRYEIREKIISLLEKLKSDEVLKELHPQKIIPEFEIFDKDVQLRIQMILPDSYEFGNYIVKNLKNELEAYRIEVHVGRTGFYITRDGLDKSMAVKHAIDYFNLDRKGIISIGDKFGVKADSDLYIATNCNVLSVNVGNEANIENMLLSRPIIQIGNGMIGTLKILSYILRENLYKYESVNNDISEEKLLKDILEKNKGLIIGIDGPTGSGKTSFANELKQKIQKYNKNVYVMQLDWFLRARNDREDVIDDYIYGRISIEEYTYIAWEYEEYQKNLNIISKILRTKKSGQVQKVCIKNIYDRSSGLKNKEEILKLNNKSIIIIEGTDIINEDNRELIDICIKINIDNTDILLERILAREEMKKVTTKMSSSFILNRFYGLDVAHTIYVKNRNSSLYDYYINNSNYLCRKISYNLKKDKEYFLNKKALV